MDKYDRWTECQVLPNGLDVVQTKALDGIDIVAKGVVILHDGVLMAEAHSPKRCKDLVTSSATDGRVPNLTSRRPFSLTRA
jgi:hypothetical protein